MPRSLIEQWFPAAIVGSEGVRERATFTALPPHFALHVWWARRPLIASRAAVLASLLPAWPDKSEIAEDADARRVRDALVQRFPGGELAYHAWFVRAIGILGDPLRARQRLAEAKKQGVTLKGGYGFDRAFTVHPDEETIRLVHDLASLRADVSQPPLVIDPFAGGGSIPFEASRYGLETIANELNPVAVAILHGTVGLPSDLGADFAEVIEEWGSEWAERVRRRLDPVFPKEPGDKTIVGYIWAHAVPCPTTGHPTPLAPNFWLATGKAGRDIAVRLHLDTGSGTISTSIVEGQEAKEYGDRSTYKRGTAVSVWDEAAMLSGEYIKHHAKAGQLTETLLAVCVTRDGERGRYFRAPSSADVEAISEARRQLTKQEAAWKVDDLLPDELINSGCETDKLRAMGLATWRDVFTPRQLLTTATALEELHHVVNDAAQRLGNHQARSLGLYMAFMLDKAIDYNSRLSLWDSSTTRIRHSFVQHDFAFKWTFAEFDGSAALLPWTVKQLTSVYTGISTLLLDEATLLSEGRSASSKITCQSATDLVLEDQSVDLVVTDPPYYDNVQYAELSDYFYVWLKRSLRDTWPEFTQLVVTDKEREAVANPALFRDLATHSGRGKRKAGTVTAAELADRRYEELLTASFTEAHRVMKADAVLTVMFTHKRVDAWDTLGQALLEAGFEIASSWPVHTESEHSLHQAKKNSAASTILLGCRKRVSSEPGYWTDIQRDVERAVEEAAERFSAEGITGVDLTLATYGPALSVLSRNWPVHTGRLDTEGNPEKLRPDVALDLARARVATLKKRGLLGGRDVEFDRPTDWWLLAWNDFQAATFPSGEALKLCLATDVELDDVLKTHKLAKTASGNITLLSPAQRRTAKGLDTEAGTWPSLVDELHALMLVYDEDGLPAAEAWMDRTGNRDNIRFQDLFEAALHAIPRARDNDGRFSRPEARILDSLRIALFDGVEPPEEPTIPAAQAALFET